MADVGSLTTAFDVFLSYAHRDAHIAEPLVQALVGAGVRVWRDVNEIEPFGPISVEIATNLPGSTAFLCLYSATYPTRPSCRWELIAALSALGGADERRARVLVLNPEPGVDHIVPAALRETSLRTPGIADEPGWSTLADTVKERVAALYGPLGTGDPHRRPEWHPVERVGSERFVGRGADLLELHAHLHSIDVAATSGTLTPPLAIIDGLPGTGKSLLAETYGLTFGAAYPGGIYWLDAQPADPASADRLEERLRHQLRALLNSLDVSVERRADAHSLREALIRRLEPAGDAYLWIVDGLPPDLDRAFVAPWLAPGPHGRTLITTERAPDFTDAVVSPGRLAPEEAMRLLLHPFTGRVREVTDEDRAATRHLGEELDHHPLAVDVARGVLARDPALTPARLHQEITRHDLDRLDQLAEEVGGSGREGLRPVSAAVERSLTGLGPAAWDLLRLASVLAPAVMPADLIEGALARLTPEADTPDSWRRTAFRDLGRLALAEQDLFGGQRVHRLVSRVVRRVDPDPLRREQLAAEATGILEQRLIEGAVPVRGDPTLSLVPHARRLVEAVDEPSTGLALALADHDLERGLVASAHDVLSSLSERRPEDLPARLEPWGLERRRGTTLRELGDLEGARAVQEDVLARSTADAAEESRQAMMVRAELAVTLYLQGDLAAAKGFAEDSHAWFAQNTKHDDPWRLIAAEYLGNILFGSAQASRAVPLLAEVEAGLSRMLGEAHPDVLSARVNLAQAMTEADRAAAYVLLRRTVAISDDLLGRRHPTTIAALTALAPLELEHGSPDTAVAIQRSVVATHSEVLGVEHSTTIVARATLAQIYRRRGGLENVVHAHDLLAAAFRDLRRTVGPRRPETLHTAAGLARAKKDLARRGALPSGVSDAETLERWALEQATTALGPHHPVVEAILDGLRQTEAMKDAGRDGDGLTPAP